MAIFTNPRALRASWRRDMEKVVDELRDDVLVTVKKRTKEDTGDLRRSWRIVGDKVVSDDEAAMYHEYGSKKKNIKAQRPMRKSIARVKRLLKKMRRRI